MMAVLGNAKHPEYGSATVPLPIPNDEYGHVMELLGTLGIGDVMERDCKVEEIQGGLPILKRLEKVAVNIDELDYWRSFAELTLGEGPFDEIFNSFMRRLTLRSLTTCPACNNLTRILRAPNRPELFWKISKMSGLRRASPSSSWVISGERNSW